MGEPLQWKPNGHQTWRAITDHGNYAWWEFDDGSEYVVLPGDYAGRKVLDAKARAQADYDARVKFAEEIEA